MALTPEQAAALGLPAAPTRRTLSASEAEALGLPSPPPKFGMGDVQAAQAPRVPGIGETLIDHAANAAVLGQGPRLMAAYRAGHGDEEPSGAPTEAVWSILKGWFGKDDTGEAESRAGVAEREMRDTLKQGAVHHPAAALTGTAVGGAGTSSLVAKAVPVVQGSGFIPWLLNRIREGAAIGGAYGLGEENPVEGAVRGMETGAVVAPVVSGVAAGAGKGLQAVGDWAAPKLAAAAEGRALKATGATQTDITRLSRDNPNRPAKVGRALLEEDIRLRDPSKIVTDAKGVRSSYGADVGNLVTQADQAGATVDAGSFISRASQDVLAPMQANIAQRVPGHHGMPQNPVADRLALFLQEVQAKAQNGKLSVADAHTLRQQLDVVLRGVRKAQDPESTVIKAALNDVRGILSDEIGAAMDRAGLGADWQAANGGYSAMSDAVKLGQKGVERRAGNRTFGFAEQVAGVPGMVVGGMHGGFGGAGLGYLASSLVAGGMKRYGNPMAARTLDALAKGMETGAAVPVTGQGAGALSPAAVEEAYPGLLDWLRGRMGLTPAAAEDDQ